MRFFLRSNAVTTIKRLTSHGGKTVKRTNDNFFAAVTVSTRKWAAIVTFLLSAFFVSTGFAALPGDCTEDGSVSISEVQSAINMFLGLKTVDACVDTSNDSSVSIAEVQKTINSFLGLEVPIKVSMPDLINKSRSEAEVTLATLGLTLGTITSVSSETIPEGTVISQQPVAATQVDPGTAVNLSVSSGSEVSSFDEAVLRSLPAVEPASYLTGTTVMVSEATIGDQGGTLTGAAGTPVEGVVVTVPAGAMSEPTTLTLGYDNGGVFTNVKFAEQNVVMVLNSSGRTNFLKPIKVEFSFNSPDRIPVPYYINEDGTLEIVTPLPFDRLAGRAGFITWHVSNYTFLNSDNSPAPISTGFESARDGFKESNVTNSKYVVKGRCWGMSNFVRWYWKNVGSGLYNKYLYTVPSSSGDPDVSGQRVITVRAHNSVAYYAPENNDAVMTANKFYDFIAQVKDALSRGSGPVMISLGNEAGGAHVVLAIGFSDKQIAVYDPNHPGKTKAIDYAGDFDEPYGIWTQFNIFGNGELKLNEKYQYLVSDAQAKFHGEHETKIEITSHQPDQKVHSDMISLEGQIYSGHVLIERIEATVIHADGTSSDPVIFDMLPNDNTFKLPLKLKNGANGILFSSKGYVAFKGVESITYYLDAPQGAKMFPLELVKEEPRPISNITVTATRTEEDASYRTEITTSYSSKLIYETFSAPKVLDPNYNYEYWCDRIDSNCEILHADSYDSLDFLSSKRLPVNVEYHYKQYNIDNDGKETLMEYQDGEGVLTCNSVQLGIHVEPGSTYDNRKYRLVVKAGDICFPGDPTPIVTGKYKFTLDDPDWHDLEPRPLSLYGVSPYSVQNDRDEVLPCEKPPQILPSDIEPWVLDQTSQKSWVLSGSINGCDYNGTGTIRNETATVSLTLVPN